jgi:methylenetetrahydrofolate--tRNA-(uracil-5-)-methyltransferase
LRSGLDGHVTVIGGGLAGSEAAWQVARQGVPVTLYEMRPMRTTAAHQTDRLAEIVCSNSLGSNAVDRALGLLKAELRRLGSLILACADASAVPAGDALAVGREAFSDAVTQAILKEPLITLLREEVTEFPPSGPGEATIVASGPLTSPALAKELQHLAGEESFYFFDAMAPIVTAESIDMSIAFRATRWRRPDEEGAGQYINCPMDQAEYEAFVDAVKRADKLPLEEFSGDAAGRRYFEGCLPIEVLAERDPLALAYGPMRPVGIRDPRTDRRPHAVVQLRQDNVAGSLYNLVGFQTNMRWSEQARVLRMIPGLQNAEFVRLGQMHRNAFVDSPRLLLPTLQWHDRPDLLLGGQITGTEGYVGSTASGLLAGLNAARIVRGLQPVSLPATTMLGALVNYITHAKSEDFQPMKANMGIMPALAEPLRGKRERGAAYAARALGDLEAFLALL